MRYITITTQAPRWLRMCDSKVSDWDIVDRTPYKKDMLRRSPTLPRRASSCSSTTRSSTGTTPITSRAAAPAARRARRARRLQPVPRLHGRPAGRAAHGLRPGGRHLVRRLVGPAGRRLAAGQTYGLIHNCSRRPDRCQPPPAPFPGEDFQMFEKDLPGQNKAGFKDNGLGALPLEMCETINGSWGYNRRAHKSTKQRVQLPGARRAQRQLPAERRPAARRHDPARATSRLDALGAWLRENGGAIYGTRGGPLAPRPWGVTTQLGDTVYVHVLSWSDPELALPPLPGRCARPHSSPTGRPARRVHARQGRALAAARHQGARPASTRSSCWSWRGSRAPAALALEHRDAYIRRHAQGTR